MPPFSLALAFLVREHTRCSEVRSAASAEILRGGWAQTNRDVARSLQGYWRHGPEISALVDSE